MTWTITERFPSWGETGEMPAAGFFYQGNDQVNEKHLDALWNGVDGLEEDVQAALTDIDSDADGRVDAADTAKLYKNNDIDTNGDGIVDDAANVTATYKGTDLDTHYVNEADGGRVGNGNAGLLFQTTLADSETITCYSYTLTARTSPAPSGTSLRLATLGDDTSRKTLVTGDGSTMYVDEETIVSYQNTSGATQTVGVVLDNGHFGTGTGSAIELFGETVGRIE